MCPALIYALIKNEPFCFDHFFTLWAREHSHPRLMDMTEQKCMVQSISHPAYGLEGRSLCSAGLLRKQEQEAAW